MELEKRVEKTEGKEDINNYYSPNNSRENLIDATIALTAGISTIGYVMHNYSYKFQEITNQAYQLVNDLTQYVEPFINS